MEVQIKMPDLATTADDVRIVRWLIEVGMPVKLGEPLVEIETDKATMDVESMAAGTLKAVYANPDDLVPVGQVIAVIESAGQARPPAAQPSAAAPAPLASPTPSAAPTPAAATTSAGQPARGMFARNKAAREAAAQKQNEIVLNATQREVARRLQSAKQTIPHFYLTTSANAERMIALRAEASGRTPPQKLVWDAFFVLAIARALQAFPRMGYQFDEDKLVQRTDAIGVAADIDDILYLVAVEQPLTQTVEQISQQIADKVARIRQGDAAAKKRVPTAISVTNLGAENIESFAAIINPGEAAILAIGKVAPVVQAQGDQVVIQQRVNLSLSVDHRVANGKYAAGFLGSVVTELESL